MGMIILHVVHSLLVTTHRIGYNEFCNTGPKLPFFLRRCPPAVGVINKDTDLFTLNNCLESYLSLDLIWKPVKLPGIIVKRVLCKGN